MNQAKQRLAILSEEKISKALLKLGIPTMVGMLVSLTVKIDVSKMQIFYFGLRLVAGQTFVIIG